MHEMAHVVVAKFRGLNVKEVELLPFGGVARIDDLMEIDPSVESSVALAGPLSNAAMAALGYLATKYGWLTPEFSSVFIEANLWIGGFNLVPALPLDGGRVVRARLAARMGFRRATELTARLGKVCAVFMGAGGVSFLYMGTANISLLVIAFFVYFAAGKEQGIAAYVQMSYLSRKRMELQKKHCLPAHHLVALAETPLKEVSKRFVPKEFHVVWVLDFHGKIIGLASETDVIDAMFERGIETPIKAVSKPID